ncbi:helix-turn-helix domain-containing protein [Alloalcanivorax marinus]|uniref:helix-turn-helix domain-containing protein n=1 Tax=Alloalcanivorax marinus TaxID=1177169 RepID=UPI001931F7BB|nr:helix-turn-helix domain-containing protein [Alloalcanivorax marinus]MBL7252107.1 helix-turn-helix domain-containing protein [Alloalcanivorax marinus]
MFDSVPAATGKFHAWVESYDLREVFMAWCGFSPLAFQRPAGREYPDGGDHWLVQFYQRGGYAGHNGDRPMRVGAGDISLLDLGRSLDTRAPSSRVLSVVIPRDVLAELAPGVRLRHGRVLAANRPLTTILSHHLLSVWQTLPTLSVADLESVNRTLVGAVAGAFADPGGGGPVSPSAGEEPLLEGVGLDAMLAYIRAHLDEDLSPARLCHRFGCSRSRLYRLFQPVGGVAAYVREQRLERCFRDLRRAAVNGERVVDVALRWGFDSQSHFCRLFRRAFAMTPSDVIEQARAADVSPASTPGGPAFQHWLRQL